MAHGAPAQVAKVRIDKAADLPRFEYRIDGKVEGLLADPKGSPGGILPRAADARAAIARLKADLMARGDATELFGRERERAESAMSAERRKMVGSGDRSEKIRTYNFPQNRITDHRIGLTLHQLPAVLGGDLDPLIAPLVEYFQAQKMDEAARSSTTA